ncbi:MAG: ABC transporter permease [Coriobacteriia bacterium]|nr:ABC transporter permease [Coriobacteriia bacterium]
MRPLERILLPAAAFAALIGAWHAAAGAAASAVLFPGPRDVALGLAELAQTGRLAPYVAASLVRFASGYFAALALAVPLGLAFGMAARAWAAADPVVQVMRPISPIAWFPLFTLWFGIGEAPAVVIVFIAAFYPALLATVAAVRSVDPALLRVARNFGERRLARVWRVVLPAALPRIMTGARIAMGSSWVFLVAGEMLGVRSGLGFLVVDARNSLRTDLVLVAIVLIGLSGLLVDRAIGITEAAVRRRWAA